MAKKEIQTVIKLQAPGGQATPAPPVGPALGQHGVNIGEFVKKFNDQTKAQPGMIFPVVVNVYKDRTFDFVVKSPPAAVLLKKAAGVVKGAATSGKEVIASVTTKDLEEIAKIKMKDLNTNNIEAAVKIIAGTARNMGISVED